jgi:hypothetical protein
MELTLLLVPLIGAGIGTAAACGATHRNRRIHFVKRENLDQELESLDVDVSNTSACTMCGDEVSPEDVGAVVKDNGDFKIVCDKRSCLDTYDIT